MSYRLGVDVGDSFTDVVLVCEETGEFHQSRLATTELDRTRGTRDCIRRIAADAGVNLAEISTLVHGTNLVGNLLLKRQGARIGLVTTQGHRQILHLSRSSVPGGLANWMQYNKSEPLAPLTSTIAAQERTGTGGEIIQPLDEERLLEELEFLAKQDIQALAVCLINAFANPGHERRVASLAAGVMPGVPVLLSSELQPRAQEYERCLYTAASAYCLPAVTDYLDGLQQILDQDLGNAKLRLLRTDGGVATASSIRNQPLSLLRGGAAAGVCGARWIAGRAGHENLLTLDIGGYSSDVALIREGRTSMHGQTRVGDLDLRGPAMEIHQVGIGGASIAQASLPGQELTVGPATAPPELGPACFGQDSEQPTLTDAHVFLGHFPDTCHAGRGTPPNKKLAKRAIETIANRLSLDPLRVARGIIAIAEEKLYGTLRLMALQQDTEPREFSLMTYGGAGPLHANSLARMLDSWPVLIPPGPAVLNAYGAVSAPVREEVSRTMIRRLDKLDLTEVVDAFEQLHARAAISLDDAGIAPAEISTRYQAELQHIGQSLPLSVEVDLAQFRAQGQDHLEETFNMLHKELFGFSGKLDLELVSLGVCLQGPEEVVPSPDISRPGQGTPNPRVGETTLYIGEETVQGGIYERNLLTVGTRVHGPAVIIEEGCSTLVLEGHAAEIDAHGNILIRPTE